MKISKNILKSLSEEGIATGSRYVYLLDNHSSVFRCKKDLYETGLEKWIYCGALRGTICGVVLVNEEVN